MALNLFKKQNKKPAKKAEPKAEVLTPVKTEAKPVLAQDSVILNFYISEKASRLEGLRQYVFKVSNKASKPEVKKAIQNAYKVSVTGVRMMNMPSKKRTVGRHAGVRSGFKKAIVILAEGDSINTSKA